MRNWRLTKGKLFVFAWQAMLFVLGIYLAATSQDALVTFCGGCLAGNAVVIIVLFADM